jgi:hypothetical protein
LLFYHEDGSSYVPARHWWISTRLCNITSQKTVMTTVLRCVCMSNSSWGLNLCDQQGLNFWGRTLMLLQHLNQPAWNLSCHLRPSQWHTS